MSAKASARHLPLVGQGPVGEAHHRTKGLLRVTMACNERCPFCNVPVEDYPRPTPPEAELEAELELFLASGERTLTLSGGEPTLYPKRVLMLTARARSRGVPFVELQTNAVLVDRELAVALAEAGLTSAFVSLLSDVPELHDELAGLEGAFARCLAGIDALLDAGVAVTLNPVIATQTQERVADYVEFVARRLPRVRVISLSAVQPHGRAAHGTSLLPDYAVLGEQVKLARARAAEHDILLINPYCGLPLCVGWHDDPSRSVEAIEAASRRELGGLAAHGIDNQGNKAHGPPCSGCALRTRCGGAWHAYWTVRGGSGLAAVEPRLEPWQQGADRAPAQRIVGAAGGLGPAELAAVRGATEPTVWLVTERLGEGDGGRLWSAGGTDLFLLGEAPALLDDAVTRAELRAIARDNRSREPQSKLRVVVGLRRLGSFRHAHQLLSEHRDDVDAVRLLVQGDQRLERFAAAARASLGVDVTAATRAEPALV